MKHYKYTKVWKVCQVLAIWAGMEEMLYYTSMCPICNKPLIPIVYGFISKKYLDAHEQGLIFLVTPTYHRKSDPLSYCPVCHESYDEDVPLPPLF